ncbi:MAG: asparagine--tRNA ligase [Candidatus Coatesbacteria bacterium]|nr:asparagine--tRNA ligase [Candidatus Coatesbacteria bacterium]
MEVLISEIAEQVGRSVTLKGWVHNKRQSSKKLLFLQLRDGSGTIQGVVALNEIGEAGFDAAAAATLECSCEVDGLVRADNRAPSGFELTVTGFRLVGPSPDDYPLQPRGKGEEAHGADFLLNHRHLWLRTPRQRAIMRLRDRTVFHLRGFFDSRGFTLIDSPILTANACEGTSTLFEVDYFGRPAYLSQSGQLYVEPACQALRKVYCFGPSFRAEKSFTRKHLTEFWMLEPEVAFQTQDGNLELQEAMLKYVVEKVLDNDAGLIADIHDKRGLDFAADEESAEEVLARLERARDEAFVRLTYDEALEVLKKNGEPLEWGDDFGAPHESALVRDFDVPVFVERWPAQAKAFYMEPDPADERYVLCDDLIATAGYGELIGGSIRIHDIELLKRRIDEHKLDLADFQWYLDVRRYGSVPHGGFGLGLERLVQWLGGVRHIREVIPFPRTIKRLDP